MEISQGANDGTKQNKNGLSKLQIEQILATCLNGNTCYAKGATINPNMEEGFNMLRNFDVIEIGPGGNPIIKFFPCKSYQGVQPFECSVNNPECKGYIIEDGLTFLREKSDKSYVIVSIGVIDEDVLNCMNTKDGEQYIQELANEIKRVSYPFAIVVGAHVEKYLGKPNIGLDTGFNFVNGGLYFSNAISFEEFVRRQNNFHAHFHPAYNEKAVTLGYRKRLAFQRFAELNPKLCEKILKEMELVSRYIDKEVEIPENSPYKEIKHKLYFYGDIFSNPSLPIVKLMYQAYCFMRIYVEGEKMGIRGNYEDVLFG